MTVRKLDSVDGFVVVDFPDTPATGIVRRARKILQSSATDLARSLTYGFAGLGIERSGASAGINAEDDGADDAIAAFVRELEPESADGSLILFEGKGLLEGSLASLNPGPVAPTDARSPATTGVLAATRWALGGSLDGKRLAIEQTDAGPPPDDLAAAAAAEGAVIVEVEGVKEKPWLIWGVDADAILPGSKPGVMNHQGAAMVKAQAIVPWGPIPVTTKALATLLRADVLYVPDFLSAHGDALIHHLDTSEGVEPRAQLDRRLVEELEASASGPDPLFLAACHRAEERLQQWRDSLPFGRPLAA